MKHKLPVMDPGPRSSRAHPPRLASGDLTYALAALLLSAIQRIPPSWRVQTINQLSAVLGWVLYALNVHSTRTIRKNMNALLGTSIRLSANGREIETEVRRLLAMTIWNSLVIQILPTLTRQQIVDLVPIDGLSCLDDVRGDDNLSRPDTDLPRPVLIWSYHFGIQPLIVAALLHARGYPIHAVSHVHHMPPASTALQRFYLRRLKQIGDQFSVIDPQEGVQRKMLDVLRRAECLYVTPDYMISRSDRGHDAHRNESSSLLAGDRQILTSFVVPIDFLGQRTWLQTGGLRLAKRFQARVVTVLSALGERGERRLLVEPFTLPTSGLTPAELQQDLQLCMRRLEAQVLAHPHMWWDLKRNDLGERVGRGERHWDGIGTMHAFRRE